ncbi:hypothetical protein L9Z41_19385 [Leptospira noguchii]|uniref:hypothetical protein n=1 Tax=Leptospira noguchii TaxID=28182 RepID=UPI001F050F73|nr:hypothetical protein [Leptospira noguchii]MCH1917731.1 hypothetical protein [Leptospira noguchii]UOG65787.1 hypothetical protein MAL04_19650 [Leptospira noguchii]
MKKNPFKAIKKSIQNFTSILIFFYLILNCNLPNEDNSFNRDNEKRVILQYLLLPPTDPIRSCIDALQAAQICLNQAPDLPTPLSEATIVSLFSGGDSSLESYQSYCDSLIHSPTFAKYTSRAQACVMDCNRSYWTNKNSAGTCGEDGGSQIMGLSTATFGCTKTCTSVSGL